VWVRDDDQDITAERSTFARHCVGADMHPAASIAFQYIYTRSAADSRVSGFERFDVYHAQTYTLCA